MRIISKHHDYYDCVQAQGQDLTCVWVRNLEEVKLKDWPFPKCDYRMSYNRNYNFEISQFMIGFCGKVYPVLLLSKHGHQSSKAICYTVDAVDEFVENNFKKNLRDSYFSPKRWSWRKRSLNTTHADIKKFFNECELKKDSYTKIFIDNACPVFTAYLCNYSKDWEITFHGRREDPERPDDKSVDPGRFAKLLKDFEFYKVVDTQQAFQEIWMYLGGVLGFNNPHVPVPDDVTMRDIKGFDNKSFKKEPTKKRK